MKNTANPKLIAKTFLDSLTAKHSPQDQVEIVKQFVAFLAKNNMLSQSAQLVEAIQEEMLKRSGELTMKLENASDLSEHDIDKIKNTVFELLKQKIDVDEESNKKLLGGIKMKIADRVIDATVRRRLENLSKNLNSKLWTVRD